MSSIFRRAGDAPKKSLWQRIKDVALTDVTVVQRAEAIKGSIENLEEILLEADFGVPVTLKLVDSVSHQSQRGYIKTDEEFRKALSDGIEETLRSGNSSPELKFAPKSPTVILVIGVNGAGKTTFIGKLATRLISEGKSVLVGAADTFRAGAIDQLRVWAERTGAQFVGGEAGSDPAATAYNSVDTGVKNGVDVVIVDTAGRLHTSGDLMEELRKINRVTGKKLEGAPHETLLVLDGTIGQNAISQAQTFSKAVDVTGVVITKLDGTARGGVVVAVHEALDVPIKFVGVGEKATDLLTFDPEQFAKDIVGE